MSGEIDPPDKRRMSPARRKRLTEERGSVCAYPGCQVTEHLELDHIIALDLGGKDADGNLQLLCAQHHKAKTRLDAKLIAKGRRIRRKADPETRKPSRLTGRGFDKTRTRKFDGSVVKRT